MMQETRLCQLDTAIQMELWQEAYRYVVVVLWRLCGWTRYIAFQKC